MLGTWLMKQSWEFVFKKTKKGGRNFFLSRGQVWLAHGMPFICQEVIRPRRLHEAALEQPEQTQVCRCQLWCTMDLEPFPATCWLQNREWGPLVTTMVFSFLWMELGWCRQNADRGSPAWPSVMAIFKFLLLLPLWHQLSSQPWLLGEFSCSSQMCSSLWSLTSFYWSEESAGVTNPAHLCSLTGFKEGRCFTVELHIRDI